MKKKETMITIFFRALLIGIFFTIIGWTQQGSSKSNIIPEDLPPESYVTPINWERFNSSNKPKNTDAIRSQDLLLNAVRYGLKWVNTLPVLSNGLYDLGGKGEPHIRPPASEAVGLATALKTGIYQAEVTGVSEEEAIKRTCRLIKSLAFRHVSNLNNGWRNSWQSALWAELANALYRNIQFPAINLIIMDLYWRYSKVRNDANF